MTQDVQDLWMEVRGRLRTSIAKRVAAKTAVEDLLQDVFLRIHAKIDGVNDPRRLISWLYQITPHAIIDYYRAPHGGGKCRPGLWETWKGRWLRLNWSKRPASCASRLPPPNWDSRSRG